MIGSRHARTREQSGREPVTPRRPRRPPQHPPKVPLDDSDRRGYVTPVSRRLGQRIATARHAAKPRLTQAQLAAKVGITREYLVRVEGGQHELTLTMLVKVAKALGVTPGSLID